MTKDEIRTLLLTWRPGDATVTRVIGRSIRTWTRPELEAAIEALHEELFREPRVRRLKELDRMCGWLNAASSRRSDLLSPEERQQEYEKDWERIYKRPYPASFKL